MRLKLKFGAIRWVVRGVVILGVIFGQNKTPDCESDVLWMVIGYQILFCILYLIDSLLDYILQVDYLP